MLKRALAELGKSLLIVAGVGYGIVKAFDVLAPGGEADLPRQSPTVNPTQEQRTATERPMNSTDRKTTPASSASASNPVFEEKWLRLDLVEERLIRMEKRIEILIAPLERLTSRTAGGDNFVTKAELNAAMEQFSRKLEVETDRRFEVQDRSVQSLRTMMARTDELLEQVIENIESLRITA
ncbi:MAG TPA: hypothetical protein VHC90_23695 [Bryobacteraceae bacterium]|nr:hypothetical protein [Bryobacteraceae bacterium]